MSRPAASGEPLPLDLRSRATTRFSFVSTPLTENTYDSFIQKAAALESPSGDHLLTHLQCGSRLGGESHERFEIIEMIGRGAMGVVYRVIDRELERPTAIKFILPHGDRPEEGLIARLYQEARTIAKLDHENVIRIFDIGIWDGVPFIIVEHLKGQSLLSLIHSERPSLQQAMRFATQIANGLTHAHEQGIIHRDLKPSNIFVLPGGSIKILDFGLAYSTTNSISGEAHPPRRSGTPAYMAPEQWLGRPQDARTDIWAMGVILFEMLAGRRPYDDDNDAIADLQGRVTSSAPPPSVRIYRPDVPKDVEVILAQALQKDPDKRFQRAEDMRSALLAVEATFDAPERADHRAQAAVLHAVATPTRRRVTLLRASLSVAVSVTLFYIAMADGGAPLPFNHRIRAAIDQTGLAFLRRPAGSEELSRTASNMRNHILQIFRDRLAHGPWIQSLETPDAEGGAQPWGMSQAMAAALSNSPLSEDESELFSQGLRTVMNSGFLMVSGQSCVGFRNGALSERPFIEPTVWTGIGLAKALSHPRISANHGSDLRRWIELIDSCLIAYGRDAHGPEKMLEYTEFPYQTPESAASVYATSLVLLFDVERARVAPSDELMQRIEMMKKWLWHHRVVDRQRSAVNDKEHGDLLGWRALSTGDGPPDEGVTFQVIYALLKANEVQPLDTETLSALDAAIIRRLSKLEGRTDILSTTTAIFAAPYKLESGERVTNEHVVRFLWAPWAIGTAAEWHRQRAPYSDRHSRLIASRTLSSLLRMHSASVNNSSNTYQLAELLFISQSLP